MIVRPSRAALAVVALSLAAAPAFAQGGQPPAGQPPVTPATDQPPGTPSGASVPVRELGAVEARSPFGFNSVSALRGLPDGGVFVNDAQGRRLVRLDPSLQQSTIVADTAGAPLPYGQRPAGLLSYHGDSTILVEPSTLALLVLNPQGQIVRVMAPPRVNDIGQLASTNLGSNAFDPMGRLVYRGSNFGGFGGGFGGPGMGGGFGPNRGGGGGGQGGRGGGGGPGGPGGFGGGGQGPQGGQAGQQRQGQGNQPAPNRNMLNQPDSLPILRTDFDKRKADTVAWVRVPRTETTMSTTEDGSTRMTALINPFPQGDDWALMSDGTIAVARVLDYRVDFYAPDGTRTTSGKLPFDWKRISDEEKQSLVDSLKTMAKEASDRAAAAQNAGGGGGRFRMSFEPVPPERLPDYVPPIRPGSMLADRDGNVWLLPVTSSIAAQLAQGLAGGPGGMGGPGGRGMGPGGFGPGGGGGGGGGGNANAGARAERREDRQERRTGTDSAARRDSTTVRTPGAAGPQPAPFQLVYDVVNRKGELVERVKLPPNRTLVGFGNDGVVYLGAREGRQTFIEKARRQGTR